MTSLSNINWSYRHGFVSRLSTLFHWYMCLFLCQYQTVWLQWPCDRVWYGVLWFLPLCSFLRLLRLFRVFLVHVFERFWIYLEVEFTSTFYPLWFEHMLDMISIFLNLLRLVLCPTMWSIFESVPCAFENNIYFASLEWKVLYVSIKSIWSRVSFSSTISLLILCLEGLSIVDSGVFKIPYDDCVVVNMFLEVLQDFLYIFRCSYIECLYPAVGLFLQVLCSDFLYPFLWLLFWSLF